MKYLLILLFPLCSLKAQYLWQFYPDTVIRWNYTDGDEFNNSSINQDKWRVGFPWSKIIITQQAIVKDSNISFEKGIVSFSVKKENSLIELYPWQIDTAKFKRGGISLTDGNKLPVKHSISLLWLNKKHKYGYFEVKLKAPVGQGIWPAFWLYAADANNEIDFLELKGEKENYLHVDVHCPDGCANFKQSTLGRKKSWGHWLKTDRKLKDGYNIFAGEWTPRYIKYYLNGQLVAYAEHFFDLGMNLVVGTGIARDGAPFKPGPNERTPFPNNFLVDYVRVYKNDSLPKYNEIKNNLCPDYDTLNTFLPFNLKAKKANGKLKNNPERKIKGKEVLTISVMQMSKQLLSLRIIGVNKKDKIFLSFKNEKDMLVKSIEIKNNLETSILLNGDKILKVHMEVNNQTINEILNIQ